MEGAVAVGQVAVDLAASGVVVEGPDQVGLALDDVGNAVTIGVATALALIEEVGRAIGIGVIVGRVAVVIGVFVDGEYPVTVVVGVLPIRNTV